MSCGKVTKSLLVLALFVMSTIAGIPMINFALGHTSYAQSSSGALSIALTNGLTNDIESVIVAPPMGLVLDNSATCGSALSSVLQSSDAVVCGGSLKRASSDTLHLGTIGLGKALLSSGIANGTGPLTLSFVLDNGSTERLYIPFSLSATALSFTVGQSSSHSSIGLVQAFGLVAHQAARSSNILSALSKSPLLDASATTPTSTYPLFNDYYFALMTTNQEIYYNSWSWQNYPNLQLWHDSYAPSCNSSTGLCPDQLIDNSRGFVENAYSTTAGSYSYAGLWDADGFAVGPNRYFPNGATVSVEETATPYNDAHLFMAWNLPSGNDGSCNTCVDLAIINGFPEIYVDGAQVFRATSESFYASWTTRLTATTTTGTLMVYLNTGTGFQEVYSLQSSSSLSWFNTDGLFLYPLDGTSAGVTSHQWSSFAYLSVWGPNNPLEEATFDMNLWYLARHYVTFPNAPSPFTNDAAILDSDSTPIYVTYGSDTLFTGQATNGPTCTIFCAATQTIQLEEQTSEQWTIAFRDAELPYGTPILTLQVENNQSSTSDLTQYVVTAIQCNPTGNSITVYEASDTLFTIPQSSSCSGNYQSTLSFYNGQTGLRYVSRHVTEVTGDLLMEIGYGPYSTRPNPGGGNGQGSTYAPDVADPLLNFISAAMNVCYSDGYGCAQTYTEYYSPLFPSTVDTYGSHQVADNWYYQTSTFPPRGFYTVQPFTDGTRINAGGIQISQTYFSRLSIDASPFLQGFGGYLSSDNAWLYGVQENGYTPSTQALRSLHLINEYGSNDLSQAESLLNSMQWNGVGTSLLTCVLGNPTTRFGCFPETSYATYATGSFLGAAAVVGSLSGGLYEQWAQQAAGVLDAALWTGSNYILGTKEPVTLWQSLGGEMSAYTAFPDPVQYKSNQGGIIETGTSILSYLGYEDVQTDESPGFMVANTECTSISAAALFLYLSYLPNVQAIPTGSTMIENSGSTGTYDSYCSVSGDCSFAPQVNGYMSQTVTSSGAYSTESYSIPVTLNEAVNVPTLIGSFSINGTLASGSSLTLTIELMNQQGQSITGYSETLNGPSSGTESFNELVPIDGIYPQTIPAATYSMEFSAGCTGVCDFGGTGTNGNYLRADSYAILPETLQQDFMMDSLFNAPWYGGIWNTYSAGPVAGANSGYDGAAGLAISEYSTNGNAAEFGQSSVGSYSFVYAPVDITANLGSPGAQGACIGITPDALSSGQFLSATNDYVIACDYGTIAYIFASSQGYENIYSESISGHNVTFTLQLSTDGSLDAQVNTGSGPQEFAGFPVSVNVGQWTSKRVHFYLYEATASTTPESIYSTTVSVVGDPAPPHAYYINDTFNDNTLDRWTKWSGNSTAPLSNFYFLVNSNCGTDPTPCARVIGNSSYSGYGMIGMQKNITLESFTNVTLTFSYRAGASTGIYSTAYLYLIDSSTGTVLYENTLYNSLSNSAWRQYSGNITSYVVQKPPGSSQFVYYQNLQVVIFTNWKSGYKNWIDVDNITLTAYAP